MYNDVYECYLLKQITDENIARMVAIALDVEKNHVVVCDEISKESVRGHPKVVVERRCHSVGYGLFLVVYLNSNIAFKKMSKPDFVCTLSAQANTLALYCLYDPSPYEWIQVSPNNTEQPVLLKDDPLDERGEAVLCSTD